MRLHRQRGWALLGGLGLALAAGVSLFGALRGGFSDSFEPGFTAGFESDAVNLPPLVITQSLVGELGVPLQVPVEAVDPDGDWVEYSLADAPDGASLDPVTGEFFWVPDALEDQSITVDVRDALGSSTRAVIGVTVVSPSHEAQTKALPWVLGPGDVIANAAIGVSKPAAVVTDISQWSTLLGVTKAAPPPQPVMGLLGASATGVHFGPGFSAMAPNRALTGETIVVTASGYELENVVSVTVQPPDDIVVHSVEPSADGLSVRLTLNVAQEAAPSLRRVDLLNALGDPIPHVLKGAGLFLIAAPDPVIHSIDPILVTPGENVSMRVRGENLIGRPSAQQAQSLLENFPQVDIVPADDIILGETIAVNAAGTIADITFRVGAGASVGQRYVRYSTLSGSSPDVASAANTFNIVSGPLITRSPYVGALLGVTKGEVTEDMRIAFSPGLGIARGPAVTDLVPDSVTVGESIRLTALGVGLESVTSVELVPGDGITIDAGTLIAMASEAAVDIDVSADAPLFARSVLLTLVGGDTIEAPDLLQVRAPAPEVTAVRPTYVIRDGTSQTLELQGVNLSQTTGALIVPDTNFIVEDYMVLSANRATLTLRTTGTAELGPRVVQILGPNENSTENATPFNTFFVVDREQIRTPFVSPVVGVTRSEPVTDQTRIAFSNSIGIVRGSYLIDVDPDRIGAGSTETIVVNGQSIPADSTVALFPDDGAIIDQVSVAGDGSSIQFRLQLTADASLGLRRVVITDLNGELPFLDPTQAFVEILDPQTIGPEGLPDTYELFVNGELLVDASNGVLVNDSDPNDLELLAVLRTLPAAGELILESDGGLSYTPDPDYRGTLQFNYSPFNGTVIGAATPVTLRVVEQNDAVNDFYAVDERLTLTVDAATGLLANDFLDSTSMPEVVMESLPALGQLVVDPDGSFVYISDGTPGDDSFIYRLRTDESLSLPATVAIRVNAVNDPPVTQDDFYLLDKNETLTVTAANGVLANDTDLDNDTLSARLVTNPDVGALALSNDGAFTYTPPQEFVGQVTFVYEALDGNGGVTLGTGTITINDTLATLPDFYEVNEGEVLLVEAADGLLANDRVVPQGELLVIVETPPDHGEVVVENDGSFAYQADSPDFFGTDVFTYFLRDDRADSPASAVTITIVPVNDAPDAQADSYLSDENAELNVAAPGLLENDTDIDSTSLTAEILTPPENGTVLIQSDGSFTYIPTVNFRGPDQFVYNAVDAGGETASAIVTISVTQPPTATNDVYLVDVDTPFEITDPNEGLIVNDHDAPENDELFAILAGEPENGVLELNEDGTFNYVPNTGFQGLDTFTYRVTDTRSESNVATVTMAVGITSLPRAVPDEYELDEDTELIVPAAEGLLINDLDSDTPLEDLEAYLVGRAFQGLSPLDVTVNLDGSFRVRPWRDFFGETFFVYQVFDGTDISNSAIVTLTVHPTNDGVEANDDEYAVIRNTVFETCCGVRPIYFNDRYDEDFDVDFEIVVAPQFGTADLDTETGYLRYTPAQDFAGTDQLTYRAYQEATGIDDTAVVRLRTNAAPSVQDDAYTLTEDSTEIVNPSVLANDTDDDGDIVRIVNRTIRDGRGDVVLVLDQDTAPTDTTATTGNHFYGLKRLSYQVTDGVQSVRGNVDVTVTPVPDDPVANPDNYLTRQNTPLIINSVSSGVLNNDFDPDTRRGPGSPVWEAATGVDLEPLDAQLITSTQNGTLSLASAGTFSYTPNTDYSGFDEFTYRVQDGTGRFSEPATVRIRVNTPPVAIDDAYVLNEDVPLSVGAADGLLANDIDIDGDTITASFASSGCSPCNGRVTIQQNGSFLYTPDENFNGSDVFFYRVRDGVADFDIGRVDLTILPVNDPPVTQPDTYRTMEDEILIAPEPQGVVRNDDEVDGELLVNAELIAPGTFGSVAFEADGSFTYTPDIDFNGIDTFRYRVFDETGLSTDEDVEILVTPVNDAPIALDDDYTTDQETALEVSVAQGVLANDSDVDGPVLTVALISLPVGGGVQLNSDGSFIYTPDGFFSGVDQFQYQVDDGLGAVDSATATIIVNAVDPDVTVTAADDFYAFDAPFLTVEAPGVFSNDAVSGADVWETTVTVEPEHGTLDLRADGSFDYTAMAGYAGPDAFSYALTADGVSDLARVTLDIRSTDNAAPQASGESYALFEDATLDSRDVYSLLLNDSDLEGDPLVVELVDGVGNGALQMLPGGHFTYTPDENFHGTDGFDYRVSDGNSVSQTVTAVITVYAQNDAPTAVDDLYELDQDTVLTVTQTDGVLANDTDPDGDPLVVSLVDAPTHGQLEMSTDGAFSYTPNPGYAGADSFRYTVADGQASALAEVTLLVAAEGNTAPTAMGESYTFAEDTVDNAMDLLSNDTDADNDPLSIVVSSGPSHGNLTQDLVGWRYTPNPDFHGTDSVEYVVTDGQASSDAVVAQITVEPVNDAPIAATDVYAAAQNTTLTVDGSAGVLANDNDVDGDPLIAVVSLAPQHGTVDLQADGAFVYTPGTDFSGRDEFSYELSDGALSATGRVIIDVADAENTRPVAVGELFTIAEDTALDTTTLASLLANDSDADGDPLALEILEGPAHGVLTELGGGHIRYVPDRDYFGADTVTYTVSDGQLSAPPVELRIELTPVNDSPQGNPDLYQMARMAGEPVAVDAVQGVLANDSDPDADDVLVAIVVTPPEFGSLKLNIDGSFVYTPDAGLPPSDSFTYRAQDSAGLFQELTVTLLFDYFTPAERLFRSGFEPGEVIQR